MSINTLKFSVAAGFACAATLGLTACSNSDSPSGGGSDTLAVELGDKVVGDTLKFEMVDSTYEFKINARGKWRIDDSTLFVQSISQDSGTGDATVKIRLATNDLEERMVGDLHIVYPEDTSLNKIVTLVQKYRGDYDDNVDALTQSNKIYAVGYGYNAITGGYADFASLKSEIFDTKKLAEEGAISFGSTNVSFKETSITGSTVSDISFQLGAKANIKGGIAGFSGEMGASFDMKTTSQNNFEYALTYLDLDAQTVTSDLPLELLKSEEYMKAFVYKSINGLNKSYPSTNEGFRKLIRDFGTHVVLGARLGGRIRQSMTADVSKITTKYDISAYAKAAYKGVVEASASVETEMHSSLEQNLSNLKINVVALGGDPAKALKLSDSKILNANDVKSWKQSVSEKSATLIGFLEDGVIPLYELIDDELGKDVVERKKKLKEYMDGKQVASDFNTYYECGTVTEIDVPKIEDLGSNTLVKDVYSGGQLVAKVVLEYIPLLNRKEKVMVIYPVINNKVRFNLGFYIGDDDHKPARVSWDGADVSIVEYSDMDFGSAKKLYVRGSLVTSKAPEGTEPHAGKIEDSYFASKRYAPDTTGGGFRGNHRLDDYDYPLVKILNHIWLREDYSNSITNKGFYERVDNDKLRLFSSFWTVDFSLKSVSMRYSLSNFKDFIPLGWKVPSEADFKNIEKMYEANKLSNLGNDMFGDCQKNEQCGLLGFNGHGFAVGGYEDSDFYFTSTGEPVVYISKDASSFRYYSDGTVAFLRLIQD